MNFLNEKKSFLKEQYHIDNIGLFGSYARDGTTNDSDIDLVILTSVKSFTNRYYLKKYLEKNLKKPVDIGYYDSLRTFIKKEIIGIWIGENESSKYCPHFVAGLSLRLDI